MITENERPVNTENAVEYEFGNAIRELGVSSLLKKSNIRKKKGGSVFDIFQFLLLLVLQNCNLYHFLNSKKQDTAFTKNTYYRFLNESGYNWKRFLTLLAVRVTDYFNSLTKPERVISLVLDDSVIPKGSGAKKWSSSPVSMTMSKAGRSKDLTCLLLAGRTTTVLYLSHLI